MRRQLALLLLVCGCAAAERPPLKLRIFDEAASEPAQDALPPAVQSACTLLDVVCGVDQRAPVTLILMPPSGIIRGREIDSSGCDRAAWADPDSPSTIAHELGHVLRLRHSQDRQNLMHPSADGSRLTTEQRARVASQVRTLRGCP